MYGRGQLCKLNDSSINNEIHERQRRQEEEKAPGSPAVEGQEQGRGSARTGALLVPSLREKAPVGAGHSCTGFSGMLSSLSKQEAVSGLGEHRARSQSQGIPPFLALCGDAAPAAWPSPCSSGPSAEPGWAVLGCAEPQRALSYTRGTANSAQPEEPGGEGEGAIIGRDCSGGQ